MTEKKNKSDEKESKDVKSPEETKTTSTSRSCGGDCAGGNNIFLWLIIIVAIIGAVIFFQQKKGSSDGESKPVSDRVSEEVSAAALELIEGQLVAPGTEVEIKEVTEESGLYKIELIVADQELTSYFTKDKMKFIPQLIDVKELEEGEKREGGEGQAAPVTEVQAKSDKPEIELFVMSHCPYGTQIEKGILPVLDALGDTVDMSWKFVDYAMHGELEVKEQMRQYCIAQKTPNKINDYLKCFLSGAKGDETEAKACMTKLQINPVVVLQCEKAIDAEYNILALLEDKESWVSDQFPQFNIHKEDNEKYGVQGSPTLVINGEVVQSGRDSASILKVICSAFNEQPEACTKELSNVAPATGFGTGDDTSGTSTEAGCAG